MSASRKSTLISNLADVRSFIISQTLCRISDFRLSFENLLPCYNLISDLKEYNLRKKAIRNIQEQLDASIENVETSKIMALKKIEEQHNRRLEELQNRFNEQREAMFDEFKESMNTYVANSYSQYIGLFNVLLRFTGCIIQPKQ